MGKKTTDGLAWRRSNAAGMVPAMQSQTSCRPRVVTSMAHACAVVLLLWTGSCAPQQEATSSYSCAAPPSDLTACLIDADCATLTVGCYCGAQPVNGVARKYATTAQACEDAASSTCALGCVSELGLVAQDGSEMVAGTRVAVRCDHSTGTTGTCKTYMATAPTDPGDPIDPDPTGW